MLPCPPTQVNTVFKSNTSSSYTVNLAKPIKLRREWMVGLYEIVYPHTWYNLAQEPSYFELNKATDEPQPLVIMKFGRGGYYHCPRELLEHVV